MFRSYPDISKWKNDYKKRKNILLINSKQLTK